MSVRLAASAVMAPVRNTGLRLQRQCACGQHTSAGAPCASCSQNETMAPPIVHDVLSSAGEALDRSTRFNMERQFSRDFSQVRVHSDDNAARSAQAVNALAFTVGRHIVFGAGRHDHASPEGRSLLAHELTHVVQQASAHEPVTRPIALARGDELAEREADANAARIAGGVGGTVSNATGLRLARQAADSGAGYFTDVPSETAADCIVPFAGKSLDPILQSGAITVVEFSATWCKPCKTVAGFLKTECNKHGKDSTPMHFYSVDVDNNKEIAKQYAPNDIPQLYVFRGTNQVHHSSGVQTMDFYAKLFDGFASEKAAGKSDQTAGSLGLPRWLSAGIFGAGAAAVAGGVLAIAAAAGGKVSAGAALGILGGAFAGGAILGAIDPFGLTKRTKSVGAAEADALIRQHFGNYLAKPAEGAAPLHNAKIHIVAQSELQALWRCRHAGETRNLSTLIGWTDQGPESPSSQQGAEQDLVCASGAKLEHATQDNPVIYYASDNPDATILIHEGLHAYASPRFGAELRNFANEGAAEYFTRQIADDINASSTKGYDAQVQKIRDLVAVIGEPALKQAYFQGDFTAANSKLGNRGLETWGEDLQMGLDRDAAEILEKAKASNAHVQPS